MKDFNEEMSVNRFHLDIENERQSNLYGKYADPLAEAKNKVDKAETKLKLVLAETELDIRKNWSIKYESEYGKMTEAYVKAMIEVTEIVIETRNSINEAQSVVNIMQAGVNRCDHRKSSLENLTKLWLGGYYSTPNGGRREGPAEEATDSSRKVLKERVNKKK